MIGYLACRSCGEEYNVADLTAGLCPACARDRARDLAALQRRFDAAVAAGDRAAARALADQIAAYEQREGVRLKDVPRAYPLE